jgi:saccharopine dehydrogenase (NADP+, L-glutamate forming)
MIRWAGPLERLAPGLRQLQAAGLAAEAWPIGPGELAGELAGEAPGEVPGVAGVPAFGWDPEALAERLGPGDVVVADLAPAALLPLAARCVAAGAHLVVPGAGPAALDRLDAAARAAGVALAAGVGLDPGLGDLAARALLLDLAAAGVMVGEAGRGTVVALGVHTGAFPVEPGPFRQKFAAPPVALVAALARPARVWRHHAALTLARPWDGLRRRAAPLSPAETFETVPLGDAAAFRAALGMPPDWRLAEIERGALMPLGWAEAWAGTFDEIAGPGREGGAVALAALADRLWQAHPAEVGAADRVVALATLRAERAGRAVFARSFVLDARADARGGARARIDGALAAVAAEAALAGALPAGVSTGAPSASSLVGRWLEAAAGQAGTCRRLEGVAPPL